MNIPDWVATLTHVAKHYGHSVSERSALSAAQWADAASETDLARQIAARLELTLTAKTPEAFRLTAWRLPVICQLEDGTVGTVTALSKSGMVQFRPGAEAEPVEFPLSVLQAQVRLYLIPRPRRTLVDQRVDSYIAPYRQGWLRRVVLPDLLPYSSVMVASLSANILGLTGILFSQQVYDRVVPAQSFNTLYVLFLGVALAAGFDFVLRRLRTQITDQLGKRADLRLSDHVFGHALHLKSSARPKSTSAFLSQIRDLESLREVLTSTTVTVLADLPFFFLFLAFFWYLSGALVLVPIAAVLAMILPGILLQGRINRLVNEGMREGAMRNALMVEAVQAHDDIKCLQAEERFHQRWSHFNAITAEAQLKLRHLTAGLTTWSQVVQTLTYATIIFVGAPLVIAGEMTTGTLIASSILGSRMMAPMGQLSQVFSRLQHARLSHESLDRLLQLPVDHPEEETRLGAATLAGTYEIRGARYFHDAEKTQLALALPSLSIKAGEKIAVLGTIGAGKSSFLSALAGLAEPAEGEVLLDGLRLSQIDPADLRREVGLLGQDAQLFYGTLRDNLTLGAPHATDEQIFAALKFAGADGFVSRLTQGLDYPLQEGGRGLSGGQRQALMLARLYLRQPRVVLLDEPTAAMDDQSERALIAALRDWSKERTLILATHRLKLLDLVDRVLVLNLGRIVFDGSTEAFRAKIAEPLRATSAAGSGAPAPQAPAGAAHRPRVLTAVPSRPKQTKVTP